MTQRKRYSADFKARIALEAIKSERTINEIASFHGVHPNQVTQWKKQGLDLLASGFTDKRAKADRSHEQLTEQLYRQIGQLTVELDWLKKKSEQLR